MITKSEWIDWKTNPVTRAFFEATEIRVDDATEILINSAGIDSDQDNFYRGFITAYREMQNFQIDDLEE